ncbi:MAG: hypothetical protein ACLFV6_13695, partial [Spirulinaceae cyanobacterium]
MTTETDHEQTKAEITTPEETTPETTPESAQEAHEAHEAKEDHEAREEEDKPLFQAIGIIPGEVSFDEEGFASVKVADQTYP